MSLLNKIAFVLICVVYVMSTLLYGAVHQPIISAFYLLTAITTILCMIDVFANKETHISSELLQLPLYLMGIYGLIQIIPFGSLAETAGVADIPRTISLDPFPTQVSAIHYLILGFFFSCALLTVNSAARIKRLATLIILFGSVYAFYAILQSVLSPNAIYGLYERPFLSPFGSFVNRHNFAAFMEMAMSMMLGLLFTGVIARDKRLLFITGLAIMGISLLLTQSRGGLIAFVIALFLLIIMTTKAKGNKKTAIRLGLSAALFLVLIGGAAFVGGETSLNRFVSEASTTKTDSATRTQIWQTTLKIIGTNMPFGTGLGAYGVAYVKFDESKAEGRVEQAHNDFLQVVSDAGIVGAGIGALFLFFLYNAARRVKDINNKYRKGVAVGALTGIVAILVHSIFDFVLHTTAISIFFILLMTLLVACAKEYDDDIIDDDDQHTHKKRKRRSSVREFATGKSLNS